MVRCCLKPSKPSFARAEPLAGSCHGLSGPVWGKGACRGCRGFGGQEGSQPCCGQGKEQLHLQPAGLGAPHAGATAHLSCGLPQELPGGNTERKPNLNGEPEVYPGHFGFSSAYT